MATGISTGKMSILLNITAYRDNDLSQVVDTLQEVAGADFADGAAALQANTLFADTRSLNEGASETLDIHGGTLTNNFGVALELTKLKGLFIRNNSTSVALSVGAATATPIDLFANAASDILTIPFCESTAQQAQFLFVAPGVAGLDVDPNSCIKLAMGGTNGTAATHTYDIVVVGV
jgi:hypothetical protein